MALSANSLIHLQRIGGNDFGTALAAWVNSQTAPGGHVERRLVAILGSNGQSHYNALATNISGRTAVTPYVKRALSHSFASPDVAADFAAIAASG